MDYRTKLKQVFLERGNPHVKLGIFDIDGVPCEASTSPGKIFLAAESGMGFATSSSAGTRDELDG